MSGPATVPLAIAALYVSNKTYKLLWGSLAAVCALITLFVVWLNERKRYEQERDSISLRREWETLESKFSDCPSDLFAEWDFPGTVPTHRTWILGGARDQIQRDFIWTILEKAGNFLLRADWIREGSPEILRESDPVYRWLNFVCDIEKPSPIMTAEASIKGVVHNGGRVGQIARLSGLVCSKLAAKETWPKQAA